MRHSGERPRAPHAKPHAASALKKLTVFAIAFTGITVLVRGVLKECRGILHFIVKNERSYIPAAKQLPHNVPIPACLIVNAFQNGILRVQVLEFLFHQVYSFCYTG
jgi:hypothetical protein